MNQTVKIMTPGPTQVRENVRMARSFVTTNPDLDLTFYEEYKTIYQDECFLLVQNLRTKTFSFGLIQDFGSLYGFPVNQSCLQKK